jgi:Protein of unknown function (DUF2971)
MIKTVPEEYPELMHYTTASGLNGIVTSSSLWATHAAFLNDSEEIKHFFDIRLLSIVKNEVREYADDLSRDPEKAKRMAADGGIENIVNKEANGLVSRLRTVTLKFNQPHIFSMCAARQPRVLRNGLLSQWRGYGDDGGYAVVFDAAKFEQLLIQEEANFLYQHVRWGDVYYHDADVNTQPSAVEVKEYEDTVKKGVAHLIRNGKAEDISGFYEAITGLSCAYKHWGFWEENEVRVMAIPMNTSLAQEANAANDNRPQKPLKTLIRRGMPVHYIELFATEQKQNTLKLPINRVIVGPHKDAEVRAIAVKRLLEMHGYDAEVVCSEIPYIGR